MTYLDGLTLDLVCPSSEILDGLDREGDIGSLGPSEGLSVVECFDGSELVEVRFHQLSELP